MGTTQSEKLHQCESSKASSSASDLPGNPDLRLGFVSGGFGMYVRNLEPGVCSWTVTRALDISGSGIAPVSPADAYREYDAYHIGLTVWEN